MSPEEKVVTKLKLREMHLSIDTQYTWLDGWTYFFFKVFMHKNKVQ